MADIAPFRGLHYNQEIIPDLAEVVIPPYDVISPDEQAAFHAKHPYNMIRLELGQRTPEDSEENNPHTRAAAFMKQWERQRVLVRNPKPALYYYEMDYSDAPGVQKTRNGFVCALRLEDFSSGGVKPHERTFQAVKDERFSLMRACNANLSAVFALYSDPGQDVRKALAAGRGGEPTMSFTDDSGLTHRVWAVSDAAAVDRVRSLMREKAIFIADGHHRYETALNYRNARRRESGSANPNASYEFVMMYLSDMDQSGLTILPTHRLLGSLGGLDPESFLQKASPFFEIRRFETANGGELKWKRAIVAGGMEREIAIGFYCRAAGAVHVLSAKKDEVESRLKAKGIAAPLRALDVVVLDQVILRDLLGLSDEFLADSSNISFTHDFAGALEAVKSGRFDAGFFINPTRIEQVRDVASAGLIMPHKSTYFYPKVSSGLVINPLSPDEEIL
ncbi:MAG: DUF1015 domain-containing protein [Desulfobacteraceae bacterium]|nr:DUF1015 domain-containing protein [Desulfobacteraceae bacterium]